MKISVIIPVYKSAEILEEGYKALSSILKNITPDYEILYRSDSSPDNSLDILNKMALKDKKVKIFFHNPNKGLGFTLRHLFKDASGDYIIYLDADSYQCFDLSLISKFINEMKTVDTVIASRYEVAARQIPWYREYPSTIYYLINKLLFNISLRDVGSGFVIFKKTVLDHISLSSDGFDIHIEIFAKLKRAGFKIKEIPVTYKHWYGGSFDIFKHGPKTLLNTLRLFFLIRILNK